MCAKTTGKWLREQNSRGAKACFLEVIAHPADVNHDMMPMAQKFPNESLKSPVPSYSARARVIIMAAKNGKSS
ncbi:MAG: hypothetical protein LLG37_04605 [Spirochaetia bacterium]|nr:hypothetical protein [Spirochaetia bacterium]